MWKESSISNFVNKSIFSIFCANIKIPYYLLNGFFCNTLKKEKLRNGKSEDIKYVCFTLIIKVKYFFSSESPVLNFLLENFE